MAALIGHVWGIAEAAKKISKSLEVLSKVFTGPTSKQVMQEAVERIRFSESKMEEPDKKMNVIPDTPESSAGEEEEDGVVENRAQRGKRVNLEKEIQEVAASQQKKSKKQSQ